MTFWGVLSNQRSVHCKTTTTQLIAVDFHPFLGAEKTFIMCLRVSFRFTAVTFVVSGHFVVKCLSYLKCVESIWWILFIVHWDVPITSPHREKREKRNKLYQLNLYWRFWLEFSGMNKFPFIETFCMSGGSFLWPCDVCKNVVIIWIILKCIF